MKFLAYIFVCVLIAIVFYAVLSLLRLVFVQIKAYFIRRKLAKLAESELKKDV